MATTVYDFVGATSPAGAGQPKALSGVDTAVPAPDTGVEGAQGDYDAIEANDASRWQNSTLNVGDLPYKQYRFYVTKAANEDYQRFTGTLIGWGGWGATQNYTLSIWNFTSSAWEQLGTVTGGADQTVSGNVKATLSSYISAGYVWLASNGPIQTLANPSSDYCNYIELEVRTGQTGSGKPPHGGGGRGRGGKVPNSLKWRADGFNPSWNG